MIQQHPKAGSRYTLSPRNVHHYYFAHMVSMITVHKLHLAIFKIDVESLSHKLQGILLYIQQYNIRILYKLGPHLFIEDRVTEIA